MSSLPPDQREAIAEVLQRLLDSPEFDNCTDEETGALIADTLAGFLVAERDAGRREACDHIRPVRNVLQQLKEWDHLPLMGDGPYFLRRITEALALIDAEQAP